MRPRQNDRHLAGDIFKQKLLYFDSNFNEICSQGSNEQYASISSDNGLAPNSRQAIIWTSDGLVYCYSIHVPGWLQKWLNLITAPGSVSNEPGSVAWLATKYLKTVSWRNHTEKLTTWWPQNISFWPKINIPSSYFTIIMLNCLKNTLKLQFDSYVTAVRFLT